MSEAIDHDLRNATQRAAFLNPSEYGILATRLSERKKCAELMLKTKSELEFDTLKLMIQVYNEQIKDILGL